jgi:heat shock protein HspQ
MAVAGKLQQRISAASFGINDIIHHKIFSYGGPGVFSLASTG